MPEILLGRALNPPLERGRIRRDDPIDVSLEVAGTLDRYLLKAHPIASARLAQRTAEDQRGTKPQSENGRPARRLCGPSEERNPGRREPASLLIGEHRHAAPGTDGARHLRDGAFVVYDAHADALTRPRQVPIEERVRLVARDGVDRNAARGDVCPGKLPIPEVSGDEQDTRA